MKKLAKVLAVILSVSMIFALAGCSGQEKVDATFGQKTTVSVVVIGAEDKTMFDGKVTVYADDPVVCDALKGVVEAKELSIIHEEGSDFFAELGGYTGNDPFYWLYKINDEMAAGGIDTQKIEDGDKLYFRYEDYNEETWPEAKYKGKDTATYGEELVVDVKVIAAEEKNLFDGKVKVYSDNPVVCNALMGVVEAKELSITHEEGSNFYAELGGYAGNDPFYWLYRINGEIALEGIDTQVIKEGDKLYFRYEDYNVEEWPEN